MKYKVILAESDYGVDVDGSEKGPKELALSMFNEEDVIVVEKIIKNKECDKDNKKKNFLMVNEFNSRLYNAVVNVKVNKELPIVLGGDHSISIASSLASIKNEGKLGLLWIDAHGDYNTFDTTITGNIHGVPFATLSGQNGDSLTLFHNGVFYDPKNCVLIGARDLDVLEKENLKKAGVTIFSTDDLKSNNLSSIMNKAFDIALTSCKKIHISYDLDVIDPNICKGVSVPAINGIDLDVAYFILDYILKRKEKIASIDLVEYNPLRDIDGNTKNIALSLLEKIISSLK